MTTLTDKRKKLTSAKNKNSKNLKTKPRQGAKKRNNSKKIKQSKELIALTQTWDEDLCE
tara:strand:+ start:605 stop:781 length:177 start_codon:yes stop_codon:yes gene_type:complete